MAGHRLNPTYDNIIFRAYNSVRDIKSALQNGTLDLAYGVNTLSPSAFLSIATSSASDLVAHKSTKDLNTRLIVLNSGGRLNTPVRPLRGSKICPRHLPIRRHLSLVGRRPLVRSTRVAG